MSNLETKLSETRAVQRCLFEPQNEADESVARYLTDCCRSRQVVGEYPHPLSSFILTASVVGSNLGIWADKLDRDDAELVAPVITGAVEPQETAIENAGSGPDPDRVVELVDSESSGAELAERQETIERSIALLAESDGVPEEQTLAHYAGLGIEFVNRVSDDGIDEAADWLADKHPDLEEHLQQISVTPLEQPLIYSHLHSLSREVISGVRGNSDPVGLPLGSTPRAILYLGDEADGIEKKVHDELLNRITDQHEFYCKARWNTHEHGVLANLPIPFDEKRRIIADCYSDVILGQGGHDIELDEIPDEIERCLPELAKILYDPQDNNPDRTVIEWFAGQPTLQELYQDKVLESSKYGAQTSKTGFLAELTAQCTGAVAGHYDPQDIYSELEDFRADVEPLLREDLQTTVDLADEVTTTFFTGFRPSGSDGKIDSSEQCFLCGTHATRDFQKGNNAFYGTSKFAKTVGVEQDYKRVCPTCELEHALVRDVCESNDVATDHDTATAYVFRDVFQPTLLAADSRQVPVFDDGVEALSDEFLEESFAAPFQVAPFYAPDDNGRNRALRDLVPLAEQGLKIHLGSAFTSFNPTGDLIHHETPTPTIAAFGLDSIRDYNGVAKTAGLIGLMESLANDSEFSNGQSYELLTENSFDEILYYVVDRTNSGFESRETAREFLVNDSSHRQKLKTMQEVARAAHKLIGEQYDDHSKSEPFNVCVNTLINEFDTYDEEQLIAFAAGQVQDEVDSQQYSGIVTAEQAEQFTRAVVNAFQERGEWSKQGLMTSQKAMQNAYLFAYDSILEQVMDAKRDSDTEESEAN